MALIKLGGLAQDVRGSLNGNVFSRNRGGAYVRSKVSPVQPVSPFASRARDIFKAISQAWAADLTDTQRAAWNAWALLHPLVNVFGDSITASGIAAYQQVNRALLQVGGTRLDDPPAVFSAGSVTVTGGTGVVTGGLLTTLTLAITVPGGLGGDEGIYLFAGVPTSGSRKVQRNDYRLVNAPGDDDWAVNEAVVAAYNLRFPAISAAAGQTIPLLAAVINTTNGCVSAGVPGSVLLT